MNFKRIWFFNFFTGIAILFVSFLMCSGTGGFERDVLFSLVVFLNGLVYLTGLEDIKRRLKRGVAHTFVGGMFSIIVAVYIILKKLVTLLNPLIYGTSVEPLNSGDIILIILGITGIYSIFLSYIYLKKGE